MLKGAINELLTNTEMPETQKEDLSHLLGGISTRLYRRADENMELIADQLEPLIVAGFTFIRTATKEVVANPLGGGSQTVKLSQPRQIPELTNSMNNRSVESTLDGWMQYPDADLSQHSLTKAVSKLAKKSREAESLSRTSCHCSLRSRARDRTMIPTTSPSRELMKRKRSGRLARRESRPRR